MTRLRHAPVTLAALDAELRPAGINLNDEIRNRLKAWAGIANDSVRRLSSRLAIVVAFPVTTPDGKTADDLRAFISLDTAGQIGVNWGVLANSKAAGVAGADDVFVRALPEGTPSPADIKIEPAQVHLALRPRTRRRGGGAHRPRPPPRGPGRRRSARIADRDEHGARGRVFLDCCR